MHPHTLLPALAGGIGAPLPETQAYVKERVMSQTMKAAVLHAVGEPLRIEQVPIPKPGPGEMPNRIAACGVWHGGTEAVGSAARRCKAISH